MAENEPTTEQPYRVGDTIPWAEARERLADADTYWLATVLTDGLPHWSIDFWVYDVGATADKAVKPGGRIVTPPFETSVGRTAILADPQGAEFAGSKVGPGA